MFKSQQYRARPTNRRELVKSSTLAEKSRKFKTWRDSFALSAGDERGLAEGYDDPLQLAEQDRSRGATLAAEEQRALQRSRRGPCRALERDADNAATGDLRQRRVGRKACGDSGAPRADCPISAQAQ
jgi:hypothetical protein